MVTSFSLLGLSSPTLLVAVPQVSKLRLIHLVLHTDPRSLLNHKGARTVAVSEPLQRVVVRMSQDAVFKLVVSFISNSPVDDIQGIVLLYSVTPVLTARYGKGQPSEDATQYC